MSRAPGVTDSYDNNHGASDNESVRMLRAPGVTDSYDNNHAASDNESVRMSEHQV